MAMPLSDTSFRLELASSASSSRWAPTPVHETIGSTAPVAPASIGHSEAKQDVCQCRSADSSGVVEDYGRRFCGLVGVWRVHCAVHACVERVDACAVDQAAHRVHLLSTKALPDQGGVVEAVTDTAFSSTRSCRLPVCSAIWSRIGGKNASEWHCVQLVFVLVIAVWIVTATRVA